jgi:hypothetical protein
VSATAERLATPAFPNAPKLLLGLSLLAGRPLFANGWRMLRENQRRE